MTAARGMAAAATAVATGGDSGYGRGPSSCEDEGDGPPLKFNCIPGAPRKRTEAA